MPISCAVSESWWQAPTSGEFALVFANGWALFYFRIFKGTLDELEASVSRLATEDPTSYRLQPKTTLLASIYRAID